MWPILCTFLKPCEWDKDGDVSQNGLPTSAAKPNLEHKKTFFSNFQQSIASNQVGANSFYVLLSDFFNFQQSIASNQVGANSFYVLFSDFSVRP